MGVNLSLPDKEKGQTDGTSNPQWNAAVELLTYKPTLKQAKLLQFLPHI